VRRISTYMQIRSIAYLSRIRYSACSFAVAGAATTSALTFMFGEPRVHQPTANVLLEYDVVVNHVHLKQKQFH
jgi:hypothetical protein